MLNSYSKNHDRGTTTADSSIAAAASVSTAKFFSLHQAPYHHVRCGETTACHSTHRLNGSRHRMGPSINLHETSHRQPLRERRVFPNVNVDIAQHPYKEGCRQLRRPHAPTPSHGKAHPARCVARRAMKEGQGAVQSTEVLVGKHREVNIKADSSTSRPLVGTTTAAAAIRATPENLTGASQALEDGRRRPSSGTSVLGDVRDGLEHWRNHYSRSTIGSHLYAKSPLDVIAATDPAGNSSSALNADPGRRRHSPRLAAGGPGLDCQIRPRRRCCICGPERSHGAREEISRVREGDIVGVKHRPAWLAPPTCTALSLVRPASAQGCWFCQGEEKAVGEKAAGFVVDCFNLMAAPSTTVGRKVRFSSGQTPFDGRAGEPTVGDSNNGSVERRLEVNAGRQTENGVEGRVGLHAGMQTGSWVDDVGEEQSRREAHATGGCGACKEATPIGRGCPPAPRCAAGGLDGRLPKGRGQGAGEQRWPVGECRGSGGRVGRGLAERLVGDGLAILRSDSHRRFLDRGGGQHKATIIKDGSCRKAGVLEGANYDDGANIRGRGGGGRCEGNKRNSASADAEIVRKGAPQNGPRGASDPIPRAACFGDEGKSLSSSQAGDFGYPLCWEVEGVWWFRPV